MVKKASYVPDRGDVVWTDFDPQAGREQAGKRPALVLSPKAYNAKTRLAVMVPITSHVKGYPFEVAVNTKAITGVTCIRHLLLMALPIMDAEGFDPRNLSHVSRLSKLPCK